MSGCGCISLDVAEWVTWLVRTWLCMHVCIVQELCESRGGRPNEPSGFRGRKDLLNRASALVTTCP